MKRNRCCQGKRSDKLEVDAEWVLRRLALEADADLADLYTVAGDLKSIDEWPEIWRVLNMVSKRNQGRKATITFTLNSLLTVRDVAECHRLLVVVWKLLLESIDREPPFRRLGFANRVPVAEHSDLLNRLFKWNSFKPIDRHKILGTIRVIFPAVVMAS